MVFQTPPPPQEIPILLHKWGSMDKLHNELHNLDFELCFLEFLSQ